MDKGILYVGGELKQSLSVSDRRALKNAERQIRRYICTHTHMFMYVCVCGVCVYFRQMLFCTILCASLSKLFWMKHAESSAFKSRDRLQLLYTIVLMHIRNFWDPDYKR